MNTGGGQGATQDEGVALQSGGEMDTSDSGDAGKEVGRFTGQWRPHGNRWLTVAFQWLRIVKAQVRVGAEPNLSPHLDGRVVYGSEIEGFADQFDDVFTVSQFCPVEEASVAAGRADEGAVTTGPDVPETDMGVTVGHLSPPPITVEGHILDSRTYLYESCEYNSHIVLLWFPLHLPEGDRLNLHGEPSTALHDPLTQAIHLGHHGQYQRADQILNSSEITINQDLADLTRCALLTVQGQFEPALQRAWTVFPFLTGHRAAMVMVHLLTAHAHLHLGRAEVAVQAASQAAELATTLSSRHLRVPALALRAAAHAALGDHSQAVSHARRALRIANTPLTLFTAHLSLAEALNPTSPYDAFQHAQKARAAAPLPHLAAQGKRVGDAAFHAMKTSPTQPRSLREATRPKHIHLQLFGAPAVLLGGIRIDASRQPRIVRLLCYLLENPDVSLAVAAEALLPEGLGGRVKYEDEGRRVARIRQEVNRARQLIGDPSAVTCQGSTLRLGGSYTWSSDLQDIREAQRGVVPPGIECEWLKERLSQPF